MILSASRTSSTLSLLASACFLGGGELGFAHLPHVHHQIYKIIVFVVTKVFYIFRIGHETPNLLALPAQMSNTDKDKRAAPKSRRQGRDAALRFISQRAAPANLYRLLLIPFSRAQQAAEGARAKNGSTATIPGVSSFPTSPHE